MAYETLLNTPVLFAAAPLTSVVNAAGYNTTVTLNASGTTWGSSTSDEYVLLTVATSAAGTALSAYPTSPYGSSAITSSILLQLSSASTLGTSVINYQGFITSSTYSSTTSAATLTINFISPELATTSINLSANATTTVLDPTKSSVIDNFFFVTSFGNLRTTHGQSRLAAYLG